MEIFPLHVVVAWLGHTQAVAQKHYLQVLDEHFNRAAETPLSNAENPTRKSDVKCDVQKRRCTVPHGSAPACNTPAEGACNSCEGGDLCTPVHAGAGTCSQASKPLQWADTGFEQSRFAS